MGLVLVLLDLLQQLGKGAEHHIVQQQIDLEQMLLGHKLGDHGKFEHFVVVAGKVQRKHISLAAVVGFVPEHCLGIGQAKVLDIDQ